MNLKQLLQEMKTRGLIEPSISMSDEWNKLVASVCSEIDSSLVPEQLQLLNDSNKFKAACCARQSGKTFTAARIMIKQALQHPNSIVVYVSDTFRHAKETMWIDQQDGLPYVLASLGLKGAEGRELSDKDHFIRNESSLRITFKNGSFIELQGADRGAWAGFRGRKIDLIVADEMQRYEDAGLAAALSRDVPDCLMKRQGSFVGIGTVGRAMRGVWFNLNNLSPKGWTQHHWTAKDLSSRTNVWEEQLKYADAMGIDITTDAEWLREKMGIWVRDDQSLIHSLSEVSVWNGMEIPMTVRTACSDHRGVKGRCRCSYLPMVKRSNGPDGEMHVYAGLDLGFNDASAVVIGSISREEGILRELHSEQRSELDTAQLAEWLRELMDKYGIEKFYSDPAWKITVQDLRRLYGIPVDIAVKGDSEGTTEDLWHSERQAALKDGSMLIVKHGLLYQQLESLLRDQKQLDNGHIRVSDGQDDHAYDAWRYLFRMVRTRHVEAPSPPMTEMQRREADADKFKDQLVKRNNSLAVRGRQFR